MLSSQLSGRTCLCYSSYCFGLFNIGTCSPYVQRATLVQSFGRVRSESFIVLLSNLWQPKYLKVQLCVSKNKTIYKKACTVYIPATFSVHIKYYLPLYLNLFSAYACLIYLNFFLINMILLCWYYYIKRRSSFVWVISFGRHKLSCMTFFAVILHNAAFCAWNTIVHLFIFVAEVPRMWKNKLIFQASDWFSLLF